MKDKSINGNIFIIQDNDSIRCGFYCIAFKEYMLTAKNLLDYSNIFTPNKYKKNDKIIYKYSKDKYVKYLIQIIKKIDEIRNHLLKEIKYNNLITGKYKKTCKY